ncbi:MAG: hypothetical protein EOP84_33265, partial [Verrucomicrobiaceae bacterium]
MCSLRAAFPRVALLLLAVSSAYAASVKEPREQIPPPFDAYFASRVSQLSADKWRDGITPENWPVCQAEMRAQLQRMLGLDPWPAKG